MARLISKETRRRVVAASFIGNFVEWFDYAVYGYLAAHPPSSSPNPRQPALLATFALFAISFLVRPLGGFFWGHIGDKVGRRTALVPVDPHHVRRHVLHRPHARIRHHRLWAPVLLLVVRIVQGFSASGEYAGPRPSW